MLYGKIFTLYVKRNRTMKKETGDKTSILAVCKYYKGEKEKPFEWDKENAANNFWYY